MTVKMPFIRLAKNLFKMLLQAKRKQAALDLFGIGADMAAWETSESTTSSSILGRHYQRRSRFREPIVPTRLRQCDGRLQGVYSTLRCPDIQVHLQALWGYISCDLKVFLTKLSNVKNCSTITPSHQK